MNSLELMRGLLLTTLASSAAMAAVLLLRAPVRRWLGASAAWLLWLAVPAAMLAVSLPAPRIEAAPVVSVAAMQAGATTLQTHLPWPWLASAGWLGGAAWMALWLLRRQRRFVRGLGRLQRRSDGCWQAQAVAGLPAVVGLWRPKIVLPADFEQRYTAQERQLVLLHEQVHLRRGDAAINAALALMQCAYWFNPLLPLALRCCRADQEFSCDERVIALCKGARRSYGNAMLKTGLALSPLPVGCHWQNHHPLQERIAMLKRQVPDKKQWFAMVLLSLGVSFGVGYAAWAAQPGQVVVAPQSNSAQASDSGKEGGQFSIKPAAERYAVQRGNDGAAGGYAIERADGGFSVQRSDPRAEAARQNADASVLDKMPRPHYPEDAAKNRVTGKVVLLIDVDAQGHPAHVAVESSDARQDLQDAAIAAAWQWKFTPAREGGKPAAGKIRVPVEFKMDEDAL